MLQLVRIEGALPEGFAALRAAADAEGFRAMARLQAEWEPGGGGFVCLLAAFQDGTLAGVGGLTPESDGQEEEPAMRVRRLYVAPEMRRTGVGRTLVNALLQEALDTVSLVTLNGRDTLAPRFWTELDFRAVEGRPWTHEFRF